MGHINAVKSLDTARRTLATASRSSSSRSKQDEAKRTAQSIILGTLKNDRAFWQVVESHDSETFVDAMLNEPRYLIHTNLQSLSRRALSVITSLMTPCTYTLDTRSVKARKTGAYVIINGQVEYRKPGTIRGLQIPAHTFGALLQLADKNEPVIVRVYGGVVCEMVQSSWRATFYFEEVA